MSEPMTEERLAELQATVRRGWSVRNPEDQLMDRHRDLDDLVREVRRLRSQPAPGAVQGERVEGGRPELCEVCRTCAEAGTGPIACAYSSCAQRQREWDEAHAAGHAAGAALLAKLERLVRGKWELNLNWWSHTSDFAVYEDQGGSELGAGPTLAAAIEASPEPGSEGGERGP